MRHTINCKPTATEPIPANTKDDYSAIEFASLEEQLGMPRGWSNSVNLACTKWLGDRGLLESWRRNFTKQI